MTPEFERLVLDLEKRWDLAFSERGYGVVVADYDRRVAKTNLIYRVLGSVPNLEVYLEPTQHLHVDAVSRMLRNYFKV